MKKSTLTFFFIVFSCLLFAQEKIPLVIVETKEGGFDGGYRDNVLQFFADSTFTLTNYWRYNGWALGDGNKSESKGRYIKNGDTLFLDDATSRFTLFQKKPTELVCLAKSSLLHLLPAKIFFVENVPYLLDDTNKPIKLKKLQLQSLVEIKNFYFPFEPKQLELAKATLSPQLSNKRNSF